MRIFVKYEDSALIDILDLIEAYNGYFDDDRRCVVFPFNTELITELESRGIKSIVEVCG